jgi:hypothetical protein
VHCVSTANIPESTRVKELSRRRDSDVIDAAVDTQNDWIVNDFDWHIRKVDYQVNDYFVGTFPCPKPNNLSMRVLIETIGDEEWYSLSTVHRGQRQNLSVEEHRKGPLIEPGRSIIFLDGQRSALFPFQHIAGAISGSLDQGRLEPGPSFSSLAIAEGLKPLLGMGLVLELVEDFDGLGNINVDTDMQNDGASHPNHLYSRGTYLNLLTELPFPPTAKACGYPWRSLMTNYYRDSRIIEDMEDCRPSLFGGPLTALPFAEHIVEVVSLPSMTMTFRTEGPVHVFVDFGEFTTEPLAVGPQVLVSCPRVLVSRMIL